MDEQGVKKLFVIYNLKRTELLQAILALFVCSQLLLQLVRALFACSQRFFHWFERCEQKVEAFAVGLSTVSKKTDLLQLV